MSMKFVFICVNYHSREETLKYIQNVVLFYPQNEVRIIVVDNSKDEVDFFIIKQYIIENDLSDLVSVVKIENKGYFDGLNNGINYAKNSVFKADYYIVGNNDITFEKDFLDQLNKINQESDVLILAPDIVTNDNSHENPHVISRVSYIRRTMYSVYYSHYYVAKLITKFYSSERKFKPFDSERKPIYMGIGALYVLTPSFFKHFDNLWQKVFLYGEEAILAGQIKSVGGKIMYEPTLKCYHNESATTSKMNSRYKYEVIQKSYRIYKKYL
ncbi:MULTISPECIES: glycosyltransferase family 2 protein [Flavobacterium]|uniref:Glycosyltransferase n=1 Tax=Flavobacterium hankyongi TaxID=1176532 RepID=A0ABP9A3I1_9FLAO|nr:glycosyltransferase [Flavobacterium sp. N1846]